MNYYAIVCKLIGPICAVGETYEDERRIRSLKDTIGLIDRLVSDVLIAADDRIRQEASMAFIGKTAEAYIRRLRANLTETIEDMDDEG